MGVIIRVMRKLVLFLMFVFLFILGAGLSTLPEVFKRGYAIPVIVGGYSGTPTGLYLLILANLILFVGLLFSIAAHHYLRVMIGLFTIFRIAQVVWEFTLGRHSLWYIVVMLVIYLAISGGAIYMLTNAEKNEEILSKNN